MHRRKFIRNVGCNFICRKHGLVCITIDQFYCHCSPVTILFHLLNISKIFFSWKLQVKPGTRPQTLPKSTLFGFFCSLWSFYNATMKILVILTSRICLWSKTITKHSGNIVNILQLLFFPAAYHSNSCIMILPKDHWNLMHF